MSRAKYWGPPWRIPLTRIVRHSLPFDAFWSGSDSGAVVAVG